ERQTTELARPRAPGPTLSGPFPVREIEVMLPPRAVVADFPGSSDGLTVTAEGACVALAEVERREVRLVAPQPPDVVRKGHSVDAGDAARIEVVLQVLAFVLGVQADDGYPVRRLRDRDRPALDEELFAGKPLEDDA